MTRKWHETLLDFIYLRLVMRLVSRLLAPSLLLTSLLVYSQSREYYSHRFTAANNWMLLLSSLHGAYATPPSPFPFNKAYR